MRVAISIVATCAACAVWICALAACGSSSSGQCSTSQVEVTYFGSARDGQTDCLAIPAACGSAVAVCDGAACESALYDLCQSPYYGAGCSDTFAPVIISCDL